MTCFIAQSPYGIALLSNRYHPGFLSGVKQHPPRGWPTHCMVRDQPRPLLLSAYALTDCCPGGASAEE